MKKLIFSLFLTALVIAGYSQKVINDANAQKRAASGFHAVHVSHGIDLYISHGDEAVAVSASEEKFRDRIKVEVKDGVLKIWYDWNSNFNISIGNNKKLKAYVSYKTLDELKASGGSDVRVEGAIESSKFNLDVSGGSDFDGKINATDMTIDQSGGSDISIAGKVNTLKITASGGSDFNGYEMVAESCTAHASGGSDISITVNKDLNASASGGSDIHYKGNAVVKENKSGGSDIRRSGK